MRGFTVIEILIVLVVFAILLTSSVLALGILRLDSDLEAQTRGLQRVLELARIKTIASQGAAKYGVYIDTSATPHQYVLFQGNDYASRLISEDVVYQVRNTIEFGTVSFSGLSGKEVVFERLQGTTDNTGSALLHLKTNPTKVKALSVQSTGVAEIDASTAPTDNDRTKDTRHVHGDYDGRTIDTTTESILLDFVTVTTTIAISDFLVGGKIDWEGEVVVDGETQKLKIHTHELNNTFSSQFSFHRDRRLNTKPLKITLSGDGTGKLIEYDASGTLVTGGESIYVTGTTVQ